MYREDFRHLKRESRYFKIKWKIRNKRFVNKLEDRKYKRRSFLFKFRGERINLASHMRDKILKRLN